MSATLGQSGVTQRIDAIEAILRSLPMVRLCPVCDGACTIAGPREETKIACSACGGSGLAPVKNGE